MTLFDADTWIGQWPFAFCDAHTPPTLAGHLRDHGIRRALVSPLDAVFAPEPGLANRDLLHGTRGFEALEPVPVINPALDNWREELGRCAADPRVRAVRLLPNYHGYRLRHRAVAGLVAALRASGIRLIVQMQMIDPRHEYHAMTLKPVPAGDLDGFLRIHADLPVLAAGLARADLLRLAPKHPSLLADLSFAEWRDTIEDLLGRGRIPARQLVFGSHTPLLITAAEVAKMRTAKVRSTPLRAIASENLARFLGRG